MDTAAKVVAVVAGALIVALTLSSAVRATILPRGVQNRMSRLSTLAVQVAFRLRSGRAASYERRDRLMAMLGPSALLLLLAAWLVAIVLGYWLIYLGVASSSARKAIELSGSSVFTLGTTSSPRLGAKSWVNAAGCLLDAAAFWAACVEHPKDPDVQLCIRAGFQMLQRVAAGFDVPYDADPAPGDPISIGREEWEPVMQELADAGIDLVADRDEAWRAWRGWRVNYDTVLLNLGRLVEAPPAPWLSDRSPIGADRQWSLRSDVRAVFRHMRS